MRPIIEHCEWWVVVDIPLSGHSSRTDLGPYPSKRLAKKARRKRQYRSISLAWLELRGAESGTVIDRAMT